MKCNEECDILIKFTNRDDPYYYCIKDEIFNARVCEIKSVNRHSMISDGAVSS